MSHYDTYSSGGGYDRSDRLYDDRDPYGGAAVGYAERGLKRQRSPSSPTGVGGNGYRSRDGWDSPERDRERGGRRTWQELDPEEKKREWQLYERERERDEWDRYYARSGEGYGYDDRYNGARDSYRDEDRKTTSNGPPRSTRPAAPSSSGMTDPMESLTILSFKKYTQLLRDLQDPLTQSTGIESTQQLFEKYQTYRKAFQKRSMQQFYQAHKDEPWFKERFGLDEIESRKARRKLGREGKKKEWLNELRSGALDQVNWDVVDDSMTDRFGKKVAVDDPESATLPPESNQILIRYIPCEISRTEVEDALKEKEGFMYLALGEPHPMKRYGRIGCAVFSSHDADQMQNIASSLSQTNIAGQKLTFELANRPAQVKLRIASDYAGTLTRLLHDLQQARKLVELFEKEDRDELWGDDADDSIKVNASEEIEQRTFAIVAGNSEEEESLRAWLADDRKEEESEEITQKHSLVRKCLDLHIDLLRQVFNCDYYSSTLSDFPEELVRRVPHCLRFASDSPGKSVPSDKAKIWAANVDTKHALLMKPDDSEIAEYGGTNIQEMLMDLAAPYSREDEAEKHRCIVKINDEDECGKPFKAQIFVQKHVLNKHREWFSALMASTVEDAKTFNNYVRDPQRPMPAIQPPSLISRLGGDQNSTVIRFGDRVGGGLPADGNTMRIGATIPAPAPASSLPAPMPLDPRASMAPKSYQDLDAGVPSGAEIELEY